MTNGFVVKYKLAIIIALAPFVIVIGSFAEQITVQKVDISDKIEITDKAEITKQLSIAAQYDG
jgi:uncharacterized ion transporter superfamily protein YfcC